MEFVKEYVCTLCHKKVPKDSKQLTCPDCGEKGILEVSYDYQAMKSVINHAYFKNNKEFTMLRYQPMMSIKPTNKLTLKVGWTPLYRAERLESMLNMNTLYVKDEGLNPTASLKDRASLVACLKAIEEGFDTIGCSSTGNAASSLAGNAAKLGLQSVIFVPKRAPLGKLTQMLAYGSTVIPIDGDYKKTFTISKEAIKTYGFYNRNAAINPHLVEGKKTVALEIAEQLDFAPIDKVFVSVGDGCTIYGVYKGFYDLYHVGLLQKIPEIIGVQSSGCCPFVTAWEQHADLVETEENTIADSIAVGIPRNPVKGMIAVTESKGKYMSVSDDEIIEAMKLLGKTEGIFAEPAGATALAGLVKAVANKDVFPDEVIVVIATGNGLKDTKTFLDHIEEVMIYDPEQMSTEMKKQRTFKDVLNHMKTVEVKQHE